MKKFRKPTEAMYQVDVDAALVGCPHDMGCGAWIDQHAAGHLRDAYRAAVDAVLAAEQLAIDRGTMYRSGSLMFRIRW